MRLLSIEEKNARIKKILPNITITGEHRGKSGTKCICICKKDNYIWESDWRNLISNKGCPICAKANRNKNKTISLEKKQDIVSKLNSNVILLEHIIGTTKYKCKCSEDNSEWISTWGNLSEGKGCPMCGIKERAKKRTISLEEKQNIISELNPNIILKEHILNTTRYKCKCLKDNHEWIATWGSLLSGYGCPKCKSRNISGENNGHWNSNKTDEERLIERKYPEYQDFIKAVLERDNYTCQITGKRGCKLVVHHLNGYHWFVEGRTDINNAITISYEIHEEFHSIYKKGNNTKEQFEEFMNNKFKKII